MAQVVIGPHTLSRGALVPVKYKSSSRQTAKVAGDGSVSISGTDLVERFYSIRTRLPYAEAKKLYTYIENSLRFRAETVQVTDSLGVTRTVRYWDGDLDASTGGGAFTETDLVFREEVIA
jgi:hypothetical protein